jgi:hypothetical protein
MNIDSIRADLDAKGHYEQPVVLTFRLNQPICAACLAEFVEEALVARLDTLNGPPWGEVVEGLQLSLPPGSLLAPHHGDEATPNGGTLQ